eukprot:143643-Prorocentrum_lima.AAC.1
MEKILTPSRKHQMLPHRHGRRSTTARKRKRSGTTTSTIDGSMSMGLVVGRGSGHIERPHTRPTGQLLYTPVHLTRNLAP